jgi:hypothetical protein
MNRTWSCWLIALCIFKGPTCQLFAQFQPISTPGAIAGLFGSNNAFTAVATTKILDPQQNEIMVMPMSYAFLSGKARSEVDMTQVTGKSIAPESKAVFKQMGVDRMVTITRPDKQAMVIVYPGLASYAETPLSPADVQTANASSETVDGHPCRKEKLSISSKDSKQEGFVWRATDLKDFPIKIQLSHTNGTTVTSYTNIKFNKPDAKLFEPPAEFDKYDSVEKMLQVGMMKRLPR